MQLNIKGGKKTVLQAGTQLSLTAGGSFITMDASGVSIMGPIVRINEGGGAGSASAASPTAPEAPDLPDKENSGKVQKLPPNEKAHRLGELNFIDGKAQEILFKIAAKTRAPFVESFSGNVISGRIILSPKAVKHLNVGDFPAPGNPKKKLYPSSMSGGGHGQYNIEYLEKIGMKYNIEHTFDNGVRVGNVPQHKHKLKKRGLGQSWFPDTWVEEDIKAAGEYIANNTNNFDDIADGFPVYGIYKNVRVGVIKTNGVPATVFPDGTKQPSLTIQDFWEVILSK